MVFIGLLSAPARAEDPLEAILKDIHSSCIDVDSRKGWQRLDLPNIYIVGFTVTGGWSVDAAHFKKVNEEGHTGADAQALSPYNDFKYDHDAPFGALLLRTEEEETISVQDFETKNYMTSGAGVRISTGWMDFRINDSDGSLGDNAGSLNVCIAYM